jgi:AcrR family transcriptional regulator
VTELGSRSEATQTAILTGALAVFARIGFEAASTRLIAAEAGVHHASLRYHFADKEELWRAAIRFMFERQREEFRTDDRERHADPSTVAGVKEMVRRYVRYSAQHPEHAKILVHEAIADTPRLEWAIDEFVRANVTRLGKPIEDLTRSGAMRLADPMLTGIILSAASQMVFVLSAHLHRTYDVDVLRPEFVERLSDALILLFFKD